MVSPVKIDFTSEDPWKYIRETIHSRRSGITSATHTLSVSYQDHPPTTADQD